AGGGLVPVVDSLLPVSISGWLLSGPARRALRRRAVVDPGAEALDVFRRPGAVAGHAPRGELFVDRLGVRSHVVVRGEIERERHRLDVAVAKQRADVLLVRDSVCHLPLPISNGVGGGAADGAPVAEVARE